MTTYISPCRRCKCDIMAYSTDRLAMGEHEDRVACDPRCRILLGSNGLPYCEVRVSVRTPQRPGYTL